MKLNVRKGLLSRWLLPFDDDTNCSDQSERHMVKGKTIKLSEHVPELTEERNQLMVAELETQKDALIKLRATIRIKIADDNDINQAKMVCNDLLTFFNDMHA